MTTLREDDFIKLDEAITIVLEAARQKKDKQIKNAANIVEDFFVNNVFNED